MDRKWTDYYDMDGNPIDIMAWAEMYKDHDKRRVGGTKVFPGWWVSTVLLGLDHSFSGGPPIIFETMVFHPKHGGSEMEMDRYSTKAEAEVGHRAMVRRMRWQWWRFLKLYLRPRGW